MSRTEREEVDQAIVDVCRIYEDAKKLDWIDNPVAFALYQVWRKYDMKERVHK